MVRVQPGPARDRVVGRYGDRIKIRVAAPAVDGKPNVALIRLRQPGSGQARGRGSQSGQAGRHRRPGQAAGVVDRTACHPV